jgi:glycosyltransferase involved in cell wall biosynthesis
MLSHWIHLSTQESARSTIPINVLIPNVASCYIHFLAATVGRAIEFSIIVATRNRPESLSFLLHAITEVQYAAERFEVIVVDDGSTTPPDELLAAFAARLQVSRFVQPHLGPASARNAGASLARGKYLVFTDDDCRPDPNWLSSLAAAFSERPVAAIGGLTVNGLEQNIYAAASQMLILFLFEYFNRDSNDAIFLTSSNLSFPAETFRQLGGFSSEFPIAGGEDRELCDRWRHAGFRLLYRPQAIVRHFHPLTFLGFWRQHQNYGRGAYRFHSIRHQRAGGAVKVEPVALSQIANVSGFLLERFRMHRA